MSGAERITFAATTLFLFVAPFASSGGIRAGCLIAAALALAAMRPWPRMQRIPVALCATFGAWCLLSLASAAWSEAPQRTWEELRAETLYSALAFGVFLLAAQVTWWRAWGIAALAGTLLAFVAQGLQQATGIALWRHPPDGGVGPFSTQLVLVAPLLVALATPAPWGWTRGDAPSAAVSIGLVIIAAWFTRDGWATPNRIVWPALLAVLAVAVLAARRATAVRIADRGLAWTSAIGAAVMVAAFVGAVALKSERFYPGDSGITASVEHDLRPRLWSVAFREWKSAPWIGHGLGREIREPAFLPETPAQPGYPPLRHAHNMLLNIAMQLGALGVAIFAAIVILLAREYAGYVGASSIAPLGVIGLALLAGFLVKNLTDDFLHRHNAQMFWALNGMLVGLGSRARR